jgi:hypothetical protein
MRAELLQRIPANATKLRDDVTVAFNLVTVFKTKIASIKADPTLTARGQAQAIQAALAGGVSDHMRQLREGVERDLAGVRGERAGLVPKVPDRADVVGEMQRREVRDWLRTLEPVERMRVAVESKDLVITAVMHAPAELSGLPKDIHKSIVESEIESLHGARLSELKMHEQALEEAAAALQVAADDLQRAARVEGVAA